MTNASDTVTYQESGEKHFDAAGRVDWQSDATGQKTRFFYDGDGRVILTTFADDTKVQTHFDADGRQDYEIDALGRRTNFEYTPEGWLQAVVQPAVVNPATGLPERPRTEYSYDRYGNQTSITDANDHVTTFIYDDRNRQVGRELPAVGGVTAAESQTYNAFGDLDVAYDFAGNKTDYVYDYEIAGGTALGRLEQVHLYRKQPGGSFIEEEVIAYTYDAFGQQDVVTETRGTEVRETDYDYDEEGRVTQVESPEGIIEYGYNDFGQQTRMETVSSEVLYGYDELGRLEP